MFLGWNRIQYIIEFILISHLEFWLTPFLSRRVCSIICNGLYWCTVSTVYCTPNNVLEWPWMRPIWGAINSKRKGKKYSFESFLNKKVRDKIIKKEGHLIENFTIGENFQQIIMVFEFFDYWESYKRALTFVKYTVKYSLLD